MEGYKHPDTPKRARLFALIESNARSPVPLPKTRIFQQAGFSKSAAYRVLKSGDPRTFHNQNRAEPRGRPRKITEYSPLFS